MKCIDVKDLRGVHWAAMNEDSALDLQILLSHVLAGAVMPEWLGYVIKGMKARLVEDIVGVRSARMADPGVIYRGFDWYMITMDAHPAGRVLDVLASTSGWAQLEVPTRPNWSPGWQEELDKEIL